MKNTTITLPDLDKDDADAVSRHELLRLIAGELPAARKAVVEARLAVDPQLAAQKAALEEEERAAAAAFRLEVPLPRFLDDHARRAASSSSGFSLAALLRPLKELKVQAGLGVLAASAAAVLVFANTNDVDDGTRIKGGRIGFFVKDGTGQAHQGVEGERLAQGSQIQFAVKDAPRSAMVVVGVDGRGGVTVYAAEVVARTKGDEHARVLDQSVVLDDSTGAERFFVVYADEDIEALKAAVQRAAGELSSSHADLRTTEALPLPSTFVQSSVHIEKE